MVDVSTGLCYFILETFHGIPMGVIPIKWDPLLGKVHQWTSNFGKIFDEDMYHPADSQGATDLGHV
ncbi:hypothetical protein PAXRUDRAFT_18953 [Paxillus rubicundulus Ve08.2h10]|uniref:Uncharacterized protein n=1 Tax=Paxillus rubicundulus Ve08.2h10 TaxID=930991 RepID=A0A0D0CK01_9AGAM|nr:hypothetical protein PAXRUDRAFT_18953 [Paxillus rubicundulus Ve08.2h10]